MGGEKGGSGRREELVGGEKGGGGREREGWRDRWK